jgi:hypothetical protein
LRVKLKKVFGVGVNDAEQSVTPLVGGKQLMCQYYLKWHSMLRRCYDLKHQQKYTTYSGCLVCEDWLVFSRFKEWVDVQPNKDWTNCELDKDLIVKGNKVYSPTTSVFITKHINNFLTDSRHTRGMCMLGVTMINSKNRFKSSCGNPFTAKQEYLGLFPTELEAHKAWQAKKHEYACMLADKQDDPRVVKALRERYSPDKDWTKN